MIVDGPELPDQFTTAVIVRFKDNDLTAFRSALGVEQERNRDPDRIANNLWARLRYSAAANAYGESRGEVTPESLIHFGNIDQLVLDQLEGTERTAHERWDIDRSEPATYTTDTKRPVESTVAFHVSTQERLVLTNKKRIGIDLLVNRISSHHALKSTNNKLFTNSNRGCRDVKPTVIKEASP